MMYIYTTEHWMMSLYLNITNILIQTKIKFKRSDKEKKGKKENSSSTSRKHIFERLTLYNMYTYIQEILEESS